MLIFFQVNKNSIQKGNTLILLTSNIRYQPIVFSKMPHVRNYSNEKRKTD